LADIDRFDSASYSDEPVEFEDEGIGSQVGEALGPVKKFLPAIIAIIVIGAIGWFAYDYFIGSVFSFNIDVRDTESKPLNDSNLKVFAPGSNELLFEGSGSSAYDLALKAGNYRYEARAPGYAIKRSSFEVSAENNSATIKLDKDIEVEILNLGQDFPNKLYVGGKKQFTVRLKNDSSSSETVSLVADGALEDFELIGTENITLKANTTTSVPIEISIPNDAEVDDEKNGDELEAVLRIKYTNKKGEADFTLYPNPSLKISVDEASFRAKARENYNKDQDEIKVDNDNYFPVEDLTLSIEITSATKNNRSEVEKWFQFTEIANQPNPQSIEITSIPGRGDVRKELQVIIPLTAKKELDIKGNVVLTAPFLSEPIKRTLTLDVTEEAEYKLELSLSPRSPIEIDWDSILGNYREELLTLNAKNEGQLDLHNIVISIANSVECNNSWLELIENSIDVLTVGETETLKLNASAPLAVRGQERDVYCNLRYRYDNPISSGSYVEDTLIGFIEVVPKPN